MKILITGGAGFIGSHLATVFMAHSHEVHIIDCLHDYYAPARKKQHLKEIEKAGNYSFYPINLLDRDITFNIIQQIKPEVIVHLAALPGVAYSIDEPLQYVDYDIKATINVLEAAGKVGVKKVLFASSSSVYGNAGVEGPVVEGKANGQVVSPYAASKYSAESFCHVYANLYSFQLIIFRFFTVYGPWGRPDMAIGSFIKKLMNNEKIPIFGLENARDYTYIDDIVRGIYLSLFFENGNETFNIGSGRPVSMKRLVDELSLYFPELETTILGNRCGDVQTTWADISKAKKLLGYQPQTSFSEGISRTVLWAKTNEKYI